MSQKIIPVFLFLALLAALLPASSAEAAPTPGFVAAEGDHLVLDGAPFVMKGVNYFPRDFAWTSMLDWDWNAVDQELALAETINANTVRTAINYPASTGNPTGQKSHLTANTITSDYTRAVDQFLILADKHHLKVVLCLNDGVWGELWNPASFSAEVSYLKSLIPHYAKDPRIIAWDLQSSIDAAMLLPAPEGASGSLAWSTRDNMVSFLRSTAAAIRQMDSYHLLAVGVAWPSSALLVQGFTDIIFPQLLGSDHPELLTSPKIGSAQQYARWDTALAQPQALASTLTATLTSIQSQLKRPMPLVLSEFGLPTDGTAGSTPALQQAVYEVIGQLAFTQMHLAGALAWTLTDFSWPPKTGAVIPVNVPQMTSAGQNSGLFGVDYKPKPAAAVAGLYFADQPTITLQPVQQADLASAAGTIPISGSFSLPISNGKVTIQTSYNGTSWSDATSTVPIKGLFGAYIQVRHGAKVYVRAAWSGDSSYQAVVSSPISFDYTLLSSSVTLAKLPAVNLMGTDLPFSGTLSPALSGQSISLIFIAPDGSSQVQSVRTNASGSFNLAFKPQQSGDWTLSIRWEGNSDYGTLEKTFKFNVAQAAMDCSLSGTSLAPGDQVTLSGYLSPPLKNVAIALVLNQPDGSTFSDSVQTGADGSFSYMMVPELQGTWGINVSTSENAPLQSDTCSALSFTVQGSIVPGLVTVLIVVGAILLLSVLGSFLTLRKKKKPGSF